MVIANGVVPPINMFSFPAMETLLTEGFTEQPDMAGPQIVILVTNQADVFVAIPGITVRNHYRVHFHRWRSHIDHGLRGHHHEWFKPS